MRAPTTRPIPPGCGCQSLSANTAWVRVPNSRCHEPRPQPLLKDLERGGNLGQVAAHFATQIYFGQYRLGAGAKQSLPRASSAAPAEGLGAWGEPRAGCSALSTQIYVGQYRLGAGAKLRRPYRLGAGANYFGQYRLGAGAKACRPIPPGCGCHWYVASLEVVNKCVLMPLRREMGR
jgi:hypothetical protein